MCGFGFPGQEQVRIVDPAQPLSQEQVSSFQTGLQVSGEPPSGFGVVYVGGQAPWQQPVVGQRFGFAGGQVGRICGKQAFAPGTHSLHGSVQRGQAVASVPHTTRTTGVIPSHGQSRAPTHMQEVSRTCPGGHGGVPAHGGGMKMIPVSIRWHVHSGLRSQPSGHGGSVGLHVGHVGHSSFRPTTTVTPQQSHVFGQSPGGQRGNPSMASHVHDLVHTHPGPR